MPFAAILLHLIQRLRHHTRPLLEAAQPGTQAPCIARALANILDLATAIFDRIAIERDHAPRPAIETRTNPAPERSNRIDGMDGLDSLDSLDSFHPRLPPVPVLLARLAKQVAVITPHLDPAAQAELQDLVDQLTRPAKPPESTPLPPQPAPPAPLPPPTPGAKPHAHRTHPQLE